MIVCVCVCVVPLFALTLGWCWNIFDVYCTARPANLAVAAAAAMARWTTLAQQVCCEKASSQRENGAAAGALFASGEGSDTITSS